MGLPRPGAERGGDDPRQRRAAARARARLAADRGHRRRLRRRHAGGARRDLAPRPLRTSARPAGRPQGQGRGAELRLPLARRAARAATTARGSVVAIVDADGRLHPDAPPVRRRAPRRRARSAGSRLWSGSTTGSRLLAWFQDIEFSIYGRLFQAGRNAVGTAGMGGNGQFNRLSALDRIADDRGPWRDRLTEDQDLGLRLIAAGWVGRQELRATVDQQGLSRLRALFRQRTRWSQGNLQAIGPHRRRLARSPRPRWRALELLLQLLMPVWQAHRRRRARDRDRARASRVLRRSGPTGPGGSSLVLLVARLRGGDLRLHRRPRPGRLAGGGDGARDRAAVRLLLLDAVAGARPFGPRAS